ncbi:MAG TPA: hypothetical protein VNG33_17085 [Polyangiaceae bacterium]|nr:hypothetical protein [Polyangiaceae bacterium]
MPTQLIFFAVFAVAALGYTAWMKGRMKQSLQDSRPAFQAFFERTGYRYAELEGQPVEAQVERAYQEAAHPNPSGNLDVHYVRDFHGVRVHYRSKTWVEKRTTQTTYFRSNQWDADLPAPPRIPIHIADKALAGFLKSAKEAFSNSKRVFTPKCSQKVESGVPSIDDKFVVYGENPDAVRHLLQQNPAVVQLLQDWAEVDVWVSAQGACFNDPSYANIMASMGGMVGSMAMGFDYGKRTEATVAVHDRVAELLATLIRSAT